jgi:hypothetical protein
MTQDESVLDVAVLWLVERFHVLPPAIHMHEDWLGTCTTHPDARHPQGFTDECKIVKTDGTFSAPPDFPKPAIIISSKSGEKLVTLFHEWLHYIDYVDHPEDYSKNLNLPIEHPLEQAHEIQAKELLEGFYNSHPELR